MATDPLILAIDQGTTSTRALVFDPAGRTQASAQQTLPQIYPADGWVEHDPEEIWNATLAVVRKAIAAVGINRIAALGITNQRETTVIWDRKSGQPLMNAIVWQDRRGATACAALQPDAAFIQSKTGLLPDSYFSATKIQWILDNVSGARAAASAGALAFGTIDAFLLWRLTQGRLHATDATNASRTMLFDIRAGRWDEDLLGLLRIPRALLPEVRDTAGDFGATEIFGSTIPIRALVGDQQGALVGQACFSPGMMKSTYGTGCFVLANTGDRAPVSRNRLLTTIAYRINGKTTYALEGSIFNAGTVVQWLRDEAKMIAHASESETIAAALDDAGGSGGVYFVPAFTGLGAPHWDAHARGAILGLTRDSGAARIVRAGLESVAYQTADLISAFSQDGMPPPEALRIDGGMAANRWFLQFLADVSGVAVERPQSPETTVLGAAFLAALGAGIFTGVEDIKAAWNRDFCAIPKIGDERRKSLLAGWHRAVAQVRGLPLPAAAH